MTTHIQLSDDKRYLKVSQSGVLSVTEIKQARRQSKPLYAHCDRALVDYRRADLSKLNLLDLDNLASEFKHDLPNCQRMAIVRKIGSQEDYYRHICNMCFLGGVETKLFVTTDDALVWLLAET